MTTMFLSKATFKTFSIASRGIICPVGLLGLSKYISFKSSLIKSINSEAINL